MITYETKKLIKELDDSSDLIIKNFSYLFDEDLKAFYGSNDDKDYSSKIISALKFSKNVKSQFKNSSSIDDLINNEILKKRLLKKVYPKYFIKDIDKNNNYNALEDIIDFVDNYPKINERIINSIPNDEKDLINSLLKRQKINDSFKLLYKKAKKSYYFLASENKKKNIKPYSVKTLEETLSNYLSEFDYKIKQDEYNNDDFKVYYNKTKLKYRLIRKLVDFKLNLTGRIKKDKIKKDGETFIKAYVSRDLNNFF